MGKKVGIVISNYDKEDALIIIITARDDCN